MKKLITLMLGMVLLSSFMLVSCGGGGTVNKGGRDVPEWFLSREKSDDVIYGVGMSKKSRLQLSQKAAEAAARAEISQVIETKVSTMLKDFMQDSGVGDNVRALEFTEYVTKTVSSTVQRGAAIDKTHIADDNTVYVRVAYPLNELKNQTKDAIKSNWKNEEALYNEFKAKQAFDSLDDEIDKMDSE